MIDCSRMLLMNSASKFAIIWTGAINTTDRNTTLTFLEANDMCKCLYDTSLASIHSLEENNVVEQMMIKSMILPGFDTELGKDDLTIGLNRIENPLKWSWIDGSVVTYVNWERITRQEPDPGELYAQIDRQISSFTWFGRNKNPETPFQRWFLCDTGLPFDDGSISRKKESLFTLVFYPTLSACILFLIGGCCYNYRKMITLICYEKCIKTDEEEEKNEIDF